MELESGFSHISMYMYVKFSLNKNIFTINSHYTFLGKYFSFIFYRTPIYMKEKCVS